MTSEQDHRQETGSSAPGPGSKKPIDSSKPTTTPPHHLLTKHINTRHQLPPDCGFSLTERIGKGSFATVYKGEWGGDLLPSSAGADKSRKRELVAIKVVQRSHLKREKRLIDIFEAEMDILKRMKHPHIVHLIDVVRTSSDFNLIMEYCSLGDLSSFIRKKQHHIKRNATIRELLTKYPSEHAGLHPELVRHFLAQLACSLAFLRQHDIVHRDVKPQNLLLKPAASSPEEARALGYAGRWDLPVVKIADFGFARFLPATSMAETLCGSPLYMAPEILNYEKYNAKADLWSVGAVTYEMATGSPPFPAANHMELIKKIDASKDQIDFSCDVAPDLQNTIRSLLKRSPDERLSFDEFFRLTAWSETTEHDSAGSLEASLKGPKVTATAEAETIPTTTTIVAPADRSLLDKSGSSQSMKDSNSASESRTQHSSTVADRSDYSNYMLHRNDSDVAVESASPSPEVSKVMDRESRSTHTEESKGPSSGSETDYVFIEKRTVEVNSLADDLQAPALPPRRLTNPERHPRRRRLSSIVYGASPTNALAQALLKSSARLFGAKVDASSTGAASVDSSSIQAPLNVALTPPKTGEKYIIDELEQLATIAKVVILYAEVKSTQLEADEDNGVDIPKGSPEEKQARFNLSNARRSSLYPIPSPSSHMDPYFQLTLAQESLSLHLKALSILAKAMDKASSWWESNQSKHEASSNINTLVQWIRDKFNECIEYAESERSLIATLRSELSSEVSSQQFEGVSAERLLFDRALEMAKAAAVQEMATVSNPHEKATEAAATCEMNYGTAVWMLKALAISDSSEETLSDDDRVMVETLMSKIAQRLAALRRKLSIAQSVSNSRYSPSFGSPNSQNSQRSIRFATRAGSSVSSFPHFTPP